MELKNIPPEIVNLVLGSLINLQDPGDPETCQNQEYLRNARLVCRQWNTLATAHLYHTLKLESAGAVDEGEDEFELWNKTLEIEAAKRAAQCVIIQSCPKDLSSNADYEGWQKWMEEGSYPAFTSAIDRITELPNLSEVQLNFSPNCRGGASGAYDDGWEEDVEPIQTRMYTLEAVFKAIQHRAGQKYANLSTIRSLTIRNLQNTPQQKFITSDLFNDVIKDIDRLHLLVAEEYNEHGPDHDLYVVERRNYEEHLQTQLLPLFMDRLTVLTLGFGERWGTMPGYFDGNGLVFPHLKTLNLANYVISGHNHFDWVLRQDSLTTLRLDSCYIASHIRSDTENTKEWNLRTHDWQRCPVGSFGFNSDDDDIYTFAGTWESVFDRVRTSLPKLKVFCFNYDQEGLHSLRPQKAENELYPNRYITFNIGLLPSPWIEANELDGSMDFGDNNPNVIDPNGKVNNEASKHKLNRSQETIEGDARAFEALLEDLRERI
ncbi:hypothetical protein EsH8_VIII_000347 [Colletotrichum jinshuiense]